jgi:sulfide:quinone oxidoreductase
METYGRTKVLIAGGGVAALEAALALRDLAEDRVSVEILAPEPHFWYRPLAVAAPFQLGEVRHFELDGLTRAIGASFTPGGLTGIDSWRHIAHTSTNTDIEYDILLIACGAFPTPAIPGALTFRGPADVEKVEHLLEEIAPGDVHSVVFAIPWGAVWSLPAYELTLFTAAHLEERGVRGVELTLVTPEEEPLSLFGRPASEAVRELLAARGVSLRTGVHAGKFAEGILTLIPEDGIAADRVVALPRLQGARIDGLPQTVHGFIPVDSHGRVHGVDDVFAAGDITSFTVKQGGIATQQADAAAEAIAAAAGADLTPQPFRPVLRGLLLTGQAPRYLRREVRGDPAHEPEATTEPLWWPPSKIVGRYLAPYLATVAGVESPPELPAKVPGTLPVEVELDPEAHRAQTSRRRELSRGDYDEDDRVERVMLSDPLIVAPEDTLGEVAEYLSERHASAAAVAEYGRLVGILTVRDLVRASAARVHPSEARVRQWMTAEPVTVSADWPLTAAALIMSDYRVHHLPVVEGERVVGMLHFEEAYRHAPVPAGLGF